MKTENEQKAKSIPKLNFKSWRTTSNMMNAEIVEFIDLIAQSVPTMMLKNESSETTLYRWACWDLIAPGVFINIFYNDKEATYCLDRIDNIKHVVQEDGDLFVDECHGTIAEYKVKRYRYMMFIPLACDESNIKEYEEKAQVFFDILVESLNDFLDRTGSKVRDLDCLKDYCS